MYFENEKCLGPRFDNHFTFFKTIFKCKTHINEISDLTKNHLLQNDNLIITT